MIYILKKSNLLYITEKPRDKDSLEEQREPSELLYSFEEIEPGKDLDMKLRPWKNLESKVPCYKISMLDYIPELLYSQESYEELYPKEIEKIMGEYLEALEELGIPKQKDYKALEVLYYCDILNVLEEEYGEENILKATKYLELSEPERNFLKKLKTPENLKRINLSDVNIHNLIDFLPGWVIEELKLFGGIENEETRIWKGPEFKSPGNIIPSELDLRGLYYSEFSLGEDLSGEEIKSRIARLYKENNIPDAPKIQDLWKYFDISQSRSRVSGVRGYRINTRKL